MSVIVDILEVVGGVIAAPFTGGASLAISAMGLGNLVKDTIAEQQANADKAQVSPNPVPGSGGNYNLPGPTAGGGGASGNAPGATTGTAVIPDEQAVINERADAANLSQVTYETQGLSSITGLMLQERRQESGIVAGAAARGLRLEGSPLYQLHAQQMAGASAIGAAKQEFALGDTAQRTSNLASYNAGLLNMSDKTLSIQTDLSNQWLSSFTNLVNLGSSFIGKFWNPAQTMQGANASDYSSQNQGLNSSVDPYYGNNWSNY
jgi:hypothetical protein